MKKTFDREFFQRTGSDGGKKVLKKYGKKHFKKLVEKRWSKKTKKVTEPKKPDKAS